MHRIKRFELDCAISNAAEFLSRSVRGDGSFVYRVNLNPSVSIAPRYNILRHAGTVYSLCMAQSCLPSDQTHSAIQSTAKFLLDFAIEPLYDNQEMKAIWSKPEMNHRAAPLEAKLGGTGLGLVALLHAKKFFSELASEALLEDLGAFLLFMQNEDGSYCSKYVPDCGGKDFTWNSLYYPGEAALGLSLLFELTGNERWLRSAEAALLYLAEKRLGLQHVEADHWALLATASLLTADAVEPATRTALIRHGEQICNSMIGEQRCSPLRPKIHGSFARGGRICPTATRLEGLLASLSFMDKSSLLFEEVTHSIHRGIRFLIDVQLSSGVYRGGFTKSAVRRKTDFTEIRIDYVQHSLSALCQYRGWQFSEDNNTPTDIR